MNNEAVQASNELVRWLKMLSLPRWAKAIIALFMTATLGVAVGLIAWAVWQAKLELVAPAVSILTIGLPIGIIVTAMVFGDGGAAKLKELTATILTEEIPDAIESNLSFAARNDQFALISIEKSINGCIAEYVVHTNRLRRHSDAQCRFALHLKLELNVRKVNFVVWQNNAVASEPTTKLRYESCFFGALKEGFVMNDLPISGERPDMMGWVFIKHLPEDFLINASERLYFAQDLAFFVRGLISAEFGHEK